MARVLIVANSAIVFGKELQRHLVGHDVNLLDFATLRLYDASGVCNEHYASLLKRQKNRYLVMLKRLFLIAKVLCDGGYDVVNIHYVRWIYLAIIQSLGRQKLIFTFYGSDFYRASKIATMLQAPLLHMCDAITFTNPATKTAFDVRNSAHRDKTHVCRFGLETLDFIDSNRHLDKKSMREQFGLDAQKLVVACGYNATSAQQHFAIIEQIEKLDEKTKSACEFLFLLTYGDAHYKKRLKERLVSVSFAHKIVEDFLLGDANAQVKLASDIMINMLTSDSFSGSMQEFLYAKNIVITGAWLPYELFDASGVVYEKVGSVGELGMKLQEVVENRESKMVGLEQNIPIIASLSSWKETQGMWSRVFKEVLA